MHAAGAPPLLPPQVQFQGPLPVTADGLPALHARLRELAGQGAGEGSEGEFTARARHVDALRRAGFGQ